MYFATSVIGLMVPQAFEAAPIATITVRLSIYEKHIIIISFNMFSEHILKISEISMDYNYLLTAPFMSWSCNVQSSVLILILRTSIKS